MRDAVSSEHLAAPWCLRGRAADCAVVLAREAGVPCHAAPIQCAAPRAPPLLSTMRPADPPPPPPPRPAGKSALAQLRAKIAANYLIAPVNPRDDIADAKERAAAEEAANKEAQKAAMARVTAESAKVGGKWHALLEVESGRGGLSVRARPQWDGQVGAGTSRARSPLQLGGDVCTASAACCTPPRLTPRPPNRPTAGCGGRL